MQTKTSHWSRWLPAVLLVFISAAGCTAWKAHPADPSVLVKNPSHVRLKLQDGSTMDLFDPRVHGDTLAGRRGIESFVTNKGIGSYSTFVPGETTSVAFAAIRTIEIKAHSGLRTAILVVMLVAIPLVLIGIGMSGFEVP